MTPEWWDDLAERLHEAEAHCETAGSRDAAMLFFSAAFAAYDQRSRVHPPLPADPSLFDEALGGEG